MTTRNTYYSDRITSFKEGLLMAVRNASKVMWNRNYDDQTKLTICQVLIDKVCEIYGITNKPSLTFNTSENLYNSTGGGCYIPDSNRIVLYKKWSIVTLLHEIRHFMQHKHSDKIKQVDGGGEDDARAWSMSVFKNACPQAWERAVNEGSVHFV